MAFLETPRFPEKIALGATGGPAFATDIVVVRSGFESRNANWVQARRRFDISTGIKYQSDFDALVALFQAVRGRLDGFRYKDWADYQCIAADGGLQGRYGASLVTGTEGFGAGVAAYQLLKKYTAGQTHWRLIRKPVSGQVAVTRNGGAVTVGGGAGQIAIDTTTGTITFVADQTRAISSHTVGASHQFTFSSAFSPNFAIGGRLWMTGVTGTAATLLNSLPLAITNVAAAVITVSVNTTGLTAASGTGSLFPQPTETLAWSGQFDVPVRFDADELQAVIQARNPTQLLMTAPVALVEIRT